MERLKRKPTTKKKHSKNKSKKKTKRRTKKDEFSTFDHTGSLIITKASNEMRKSFGRDRSAGEKPKTANIQGSRRTKLDQEIHNISKIRPSNSKDSRNDVSNKLYINSTYSHKTGTEKDSIFNRKIPATNKGMTKDKVLRENKSSDTQILNMITGLDKDAIMLNIRSEEDTKRIGKKKDKNSKTPQPHLLHKPEPAKKLDNKPTALVQNAKPDEKLEVYSKLKSKKVETEETKGTSLISTKPQTTSLQNSTKKTPK